MRAANPGRSASVAEQLRYTQRLIAAGERLKHRAEGRTGTIIEGEVIADEPTALPAHTAELDWES